MTIRLVKVLFKIQIYAVEVAVWMCKCECVVDSSIMVLKFFGCNRLLTFEINAFVIFYGCK